VNADTRPHAVVLQTALAPSARVIAAKALAEGRHGSSEQVKGVLFQAAKDDPCPAVRAECIGLLCKLGYYHTPFLDHLKAACDDPSEEVQKAARQALHKMTPRR
jgi:hypothetical protein